MKKQDEDKEIDLEVELERTLANGDENQVNAILDLLSESINSEDVRVNLNLFEEPKSEKNMPLLTSTDLNHDHIQHLLKNALENGNAQMIDYYLFLLGAGV